MIKSKKYCKNEKTNVVPCVGGWVVGREAPGLSWGLKPNSDHVFRCFHCITLTCRVICHIMINCTVFLNFFRPHINETCAATSVSDGIINILEV